MKILLDSENMSAQRKRKLHTAPGRGISFEVKAKANFPTISLALWPWAGHTAGSVSILR